MLNLIQLNIMSIQKKFVQFLTVRIGVECKVCMHLVPVEDEETVDAVTALFRTGNFDCVDYSSDDYGTKLTKDDLAVKKALRKYKTDLLMHESVCEVDDDCDECDSDSDEAAKRHVSLPEGSVIVKVVTRYVKLC